MSDGASGLPRPGDGQILRPWRQAISSLALILSFALCLHALFEGAASVLAGGADTGWLIATGQYILQAGQLPSHDIFTWTANDRPYICYQWLFEIFVALLYRAGGLSAVGAAALFCLSLLTVYAMPRLARERGVPIALSLLIISTCLTPFWFFARPQLVTYICAFLYIQILEYFRSSPQSKIIYFLPLLSVLWTNLHCFAILGTLLIMPYLLCAAASRDKDKDQDRDKFKSLLFVSITSVLALFCAPFDLPTIFLSIDTFLHTDPASCNELKPLYATSLLWSKANIYTFGALILLLFKARKISAPGLIIAFGALSAGLLVARLQPLAVLLSWPAVCTGLGHLWGRYRTTQTTQTTQTKPASQPYAPGLVGSEQKAVIADSSDLPVGLNWLMAVGCGLIGLCLWFTRYPNEDDARQAYLGAPQTLQFVAAHFGRSNRIFNDTVSGSRLIFLSGPPVYIDSRLFLFAQDFYRSWLEQLNAPPGRADTVRAWRRFAACRGIDTVVLSHGLSFYETLLAAQDWRLIMDDGQTSLWLLDCPANFAFLKKMAVDPEHGGSLGLSGEALVNDRVALAAKHYKSAQIFLTAGKFALARSEAQASLRQVQSEAVRAFCTNIESKADRLSD